MKSKVVFFPKLEELCFKDEDLAFKVSDEELNLLVKDEMDRIAKKHGKIVETESDYTIEFGDIVMLRAKSKNPKYNKPMIPVTVGKNIFNEILESEIMGMKKGEKKSISLQGDDVEVEILKIKTREIPDLTLDMINEEAEGEFEEFKSIEDFQSLLKEQAEEMMVMDYYYRGPAVYVKDEIISKMEVEISEEEYEIYRNKVLMSIKKEAMHEEIPFEEFLFTMFEDTSQLTPENIMEKVEKNIRRDFIFKLYAESMADEVDRDEIEKEYDNNIKGYCMEMNIPEDEMKKEFTLDDFISQYMVMNVQNMILDKYLSEKK